MSNPTPPPTTYDHKPAYEFAESLRERADFSGKIEGVQVAPPSWYAWALVEAYMAGRAAALAEADEEPQYHIDLPLPAADGEWSFCVKLNTCPRCRWVQRQRSKGRYGPEKRV